MQPNKSYIKYSLLSEEQLELDPIFSLMESGNDNLFITGRAGTGKSTLLRAFVAKTKKNVVVLAPTGIAAVNVNGQTIHSFFRIPPELPLEDNKHKHGSIYKKVDTIIIDEISMVRADLFDAIDTIMRRAKRSELPFGGTQLILFGDLFQLPPVAEPQMREILLKRYGYGSVYFFSSDAFKDTPIKIIELATIYRQSDINFIRFLDKIRANTVSEKDLWYINERVAPTITDKHVILATRNYIVDEYNRKNLQKLPGKYSVYTAKFEGAFKESEAPADIFLRLKEGARVIFLRNDPDGKWVNGTLGTVVGLGADYASVKLDDTSEIVNVKETKWKKLMFHYNSYENKIDAVEAGSFTQLPLRLAWSLTIHKSQGQTISRLLLDLTSSPWEHGQVYVALSRCTSINGLVLKQYLSPKDIIVDSRIVDFFNNIPEPYPEKPDSSCGFVISGLCYDSLSNIGKQCVADFKKLGSDFSQDFSFDGDKVVIKQKGMSRCGICGHFRKLVEEHSKTSGADSEFMFFNCKSENNSCKARTAPCLKGYIRDLKKKTQ